ncbi:MAG: hypothetical protein HQK89_10515 [Nitrospirae bacterium]|nr:hypothetical protein [Nitrospirota bacterium]
MRQRYDIILKKILKNIPKRFLQILTGFDEGKFLDTNFTDFLRREPDLVIELPDDSIFHLELQSMNEPEMPWRMIEYFLLIRKKYKKPTRQMLLYVGDEPLRMGDRLYIDRLTYSYDVWDVREVDCAELLESSNPDDAVLAMLCRTDNPETTIKAIVNRLMGLPEKEKKDYAMGLTELARLRGLALTVRKEVENKMPLSIEISKDELYLEGKHEGLIEGKREGLIEGIEVVLCVQYREEGSVLMESIKKLDDIGKLEQLKETIRNEKNIETIKEFIDSL